LSQTGICGVIPAPTNQPRNSASKTLEVAQGLYDGLSKKITTYPRAEVRHLPRSLMSDVPKIVAGLQVGQSFSTIPVAEPPVVRRGANGTFYDKGLEGASHHAVIPNVNTSTSCRRSGPACRPTRRNYSTSSRGPIWPL
jgi:DNA topoisomerase IA